MSNRSQILCVSLNPSIDRRIRVSRLGLGEVNRASSAEPEAGGKAAHVAFAAHALAAEVRWLGFLGGPEGEGCRAGLQMRGITPVGVPITGRNRMNFEIIDDSTGEITEILEPGPEISESELASFLQQFAIEVRNCSVAVVSGSLPRGVPTSICADLIAHAKTAGCAILLDTSGEALSRALVAQPMLIKPNRHEAEALLGKNIRTTNDAVAAARELKGRGPETVVISLGAEGAIAVGDQVLHGIPPQVTAISTVGSGDSFIAGWALATTQNRLPEERLRFAIACGAANCTSHSPGMISSKEVARLSPQVTIQHWGD